MALEAGIGAAISDCSSHQLVFIDLLTLVSSCPDSTGEIEVVELRF
jgi:hypothetical protein